MPDLTLRQLQHMPFPGILEHGKDQFFTKLTTPRVNFSCLNKKTGGVARRGGAVQRGGSGLLLAPLSEDRCGDGLLGETGQADRDGGGSRQGRGSSAEMNALGTPSSPRNQGGTSSPRNGREKLWHSWLCLWAKTLPVTQPF